MRLFLILSLFFANLTWAEMNANPYQSLGGGGFGGGGGGQASQDSGKSKEAREAIKKQREEGQKVYDDLAQKGQEFNDKAAEAQKTGFDELTTGLPDVSKELTELADKQKADRDTYETGYAEEKKATDERTAEIVKTLQEGNQARLEATENQGKMEAAIRAIQSEQPVYNPPPVEEPLTRGSAKNSGTFTSTPTEPFSAASTHETGSVHSSN